MKRRWLNMLACGMVLHLAGQAVAENGESRPADAKRYELLRIGPQSGRENAAFFKADGERLVIFVPGAVFDKASWYFLAERLQARGIASLALDGKTKQAVLAAVAVAKEKGFGRITLVGGSMGGAAVLDALAARTDPCIAQAILLAPAGGAPIKSASVEKLFLVAKGDGFLPGVKRVYAASAEPRKLVELDGSAHAQHLFKTDQREALIRAMIDFVVGDQ